MTREIETRKLPGFGWILQWRGDGFWRDLDYAQHEGPSAEDEWVRWTGTARPQARGGDWGGVTHLPYSEPFYRQFPG